MPLPLLQSEPNPNFWDNQAADYLPTTAWDKLSTEFELAGKSTAISNISEMMDLKERENNPNQKTLSIEELNQKYGGLGITWTEPKKASVAEYIVQKQQEKNVLQNRILRGPEGAANSIAGFGAGVAAHLLDPLELGVGLAGGWAFRAAGLLAEGGIGMALARGAAEGALTQVPFEALNIAHDRQMQMDVSAMTSLQNVMFGAVGGAALEGIGYGMKSIINRKALGSVAHETPALTESAAAQMADGRRPNLKPFVDVFERERLGMGPRPSEFDYSGRANYKFESLSTENPVTKKMYSGSTSQMEKFAELAHGEFKNSRRDFGEGVYMVDDPYVANGYAGSSFSDTSGVVHELDVAGAKLASLDAPMPEGLRAGVLDALAKAPDEEAAHAIAKLVESGEQVPLGSVYDALDGAPKEAKEAINQSLKEAGYDGIHFTDGDSSGAVKHNGMMLFDEAKGKISQAGAYEADQRFLGGLTQDEKDALIRSYNEKQNQIFHDPLEIKEMNDLASRAVNQDLTAEVEQAFTAAKEGLAELEAQGLISPEEAATMKEVETQVAAQQKQGESVIKAMFACVGGK